MGPHTAWGNSDCFHPLDILKTVPSTCCVEDLSKVGGGLWKIKLTGTLYSETWPNGRGKYQMNEYKTEDVVTNWVRY